MLKIISTIFFIILAHNTFASLPLFEQKPLPYEQGFVSYTVKENANLMSAFGTTNRQIILFKNYGEKKVTLHYKDEKLLSRMVITPTKIYTFFPEDKKYSLDRTDQYPGLNEFQAVYDELNKKQKTNYQRFITAAEMIESFEDESEIFISDYRYEGNICKLVIDKSILEDENLTGHYDYNCYLSDNLLILSKTQPVIEFNTEEKPAEHFFDIKIPTNYTKIDSIMQGFSKLVEKNGGVSTQRIPPREEIKKYLLGMVNNESKIKRMETKAINIVNSIKPHIENYMQLVLNAKRAKNQQTGESDHSLKKQQNSNSDESKNIEEKAMQAGLDILDSFFSNLQNGCTEAC